MATPKSSSKAPSTLPDAGGKRFGIVVSEYHGDITDRLLAGCQATLEGAGASADNIEIIRVPGAYELPMGARILMGKHRFDAIICLGCVIKGETQHDVYINHAISVGMMQLSLTSHTPVIFGVLTPNTQAQAEARAGGDHGNKGIEAAEAAIRMAALQQTVGQSKQKIGFA